MNAVALPKSSPYGTVLKAVIIYDDFDSATRATALLERVAVRADEGMKWDIKPWKLDVLKQPTLAALTVAVAANADLIVLAMRRIHSTSAELLNWLKDWLEHQRIEDAAVMALYSGRNQIPSPFWNKLKALVEGHGLTLLDSHHVWNGGGSVPFANRLQQRKRLVAPAWPPSLAERLPGPNHWGINE